MTRHRIDVCNGDADGLCAVLQWRLHDPHAARLVIGLKRDIGLLARVQAGPGDEVNVFDISARRNRAALVHLLQMGARVNYFDHHSVEDLPAHPLLQACIDDSDDICTSWLVDRHLQGAHRAWAVVGCYGDNMIEAADRLVRESGITEPDRAKLRLMGEVINYNAYGEDLRDVYMAPATLYKKLVRHADPLAAWSESFMGDLVRRREEDLARARNCQPHWSSKGACVRILPDADWSRRVIGTWANDLANAEPGRAHAVLQRLPDGGFQASVRAPLLRPRGAHELCMRFGGAGRARAAGVDVLAQAELPRFVEAFASAFPEVPTE